VTLGNDNGTEGQTDGQTDRRTDRVRRNMRPPPREEGRIINFSQSSANFTYLTEVVAMRYGRLQMIVCKQFLTKIVNSE